MSDERRPSDDHPEWRKTVTKALEKADEAASKLDSASDLPVRYDTVHCKWCGDAHLCGFADREHAERRSAPPSRCDENCVLDYPHVGKCRVVPVSSKDSHTCPTCGGPDGRK